MSDLTPLQQLLVALDVEWALLARVDQLVEQLTQHLNEIRADSDLVHADETAAALAAWNELDELGVDLNVPTLKTLLAAHAASHPASDGSSPAEPISTGGIPLPPSLPSEQPTGDAATPRTAPTSLSDLVEPPPSVPPYIGSEEEP